MITVDDIKDFHLDTQPSIVLLETIEINHSAWDEPLRLVTNHADGFTALIENDEEVFFQFVPLLIKRGNTSDDLDQSLSITIGELGEVTPELIKQVRDANSDEKPAVIYRAYVFDAVSMQLIKNKPIDTVVGLHIKQMNRDYQATTFEAKNTDKNAMRTGMLYSLQAFPDLKGLL